VKNLHHKRLPDWETFDRITFEVVPRYKTSGLSGDEWRQHVEITFWHKGEAIVTAGARDMQSALLLAGAKYLENQGPIPNEVIKLDETLCDQPSCVRTAEGRFRIKEEFSERGFKLHADESRYHDSYRQFCKKHVRRGDCSREDSDDNYEALDAATPGDSTNVEESPAGVAAVSVDSPDDIAAAVASLAREVKP